jgi:hypothetical protein
MTMMTVCILRSDPSHPLIVDSLETGKRMFTESVHGSDVRFEKELGLRYWSVWLGDKVVGWINLMPVVTKDE